MLTDTVDNTMEDVNLKRRTGLQWQKPIFVGKKKRSWQSLSLEKDSDSDVVHVNNRVGAVRRHEGQLSARKPRYYPNEAGTTVKEWNVLYTTQLTQKAKKYHDGILRLISGSITSQVILLNEDGTELGKKHLQSTDRIKTGHDCELPNYLIEICESRTIPVDNNCLSGGFLEQVAGSRNLRKEKTNCEGRADIKSMPNDDQIRHSGPVDYGSSDEAGSTDINVNSTQEWTALYTTQKTQKAKKYHDGIFRLVSRGSHMKQIIILNEEGEVLNSRYLKSTESVEPGCSYEFPNYLVEICESIAPIRDNDPGCSVKKEATCTSSKVSKSMDIQSVVHSKSLLNEWAVLYTTQKTQKAKKYHDGVLRLVNCGSHMKQIVLLNEEGDILNSRYLKSTEIVEAGCSYEFPNYLVEVSELKTPAGEQAICKVFDKAEANNKNIKATHETEGDLPKKHLEQVTDCRISNTEVLSTPISTYDQKDSKVIDCNMDGSTSGNNRQIRDVSQILSFVRKPIQPHIIVLDAANTYKIPDTSVREPKEDILNGNATEMHGDRNLHPQSTQETASLNLLSGELSIGPQPIEQDIDHDYTKSEHLSRSSITSEVSYDHIHSSPKYVQENLLKNSLISSRISPEDIGVDKNSSLSDEIMNLQQEWTALSHHALTIGNTHDHISSLKNDMHVSNNNVADHPSCNNLEKRDTGVRSVSDVNGFPSFDLGFD